jgi:arylamine N-acetyltransferase
MHTAGASPFTNFDLLLSKPVVQDAEGALDTLLNGLGGCLCFNHCTLVETVLKELGYKAYRKTGEVYVANYGVFTANNIHASVWVDLPNEGTRVLRHSACKKEMVELAHIFTVLSSVQQSVYVL